MVDELVLGYGLAVVIHPGCEERVCVRLDVPEGKSHQICGQSANRQANAGKKGKEEGRWKEDEGGEKNSRIDVRRRWPLRRIASNIDLVRMLVHAYPVDAHRGREAEILDVDVSKRLRDAQICEDVLFTIRSAAYHLHQLRRDRHTHHRLLRYRARRDSRFEVRAHARSTQRPRHLVIRDPGNVLRASAHQHKGKCAEKGHVRRYRTPARTRSRARSSTRQ